MTELERIAAAVGRLSQWADCARDQALRNALSEISRTIRDALADIADKIDPKQKPRDRK